MKKHIASGTKEKAKILRQNMTDTEKILWRWLRLKQLNGYRFRRQVPIGKYIADFVCHKARLVIELDGGQHDLSSPKECARTEFLNKQGYDVLRFWNHDILENMTGAYDMIDEKLRRHHPHPTLPHQGGGL